MRARCLATTVLLLLPAAAGAEQLDYGIRTRGGWTENVLGVSNEDPAGEEDDYSARISPWAQVSDKEGDLSWSLLYQPSYEYYLDQSDLRGFDHDVTGQAAWRVGERTTLFASDSFRRYKSVTRFNENAPGEEVVLRGERQELETNAATLGISRLLSPRDEIVLTGTFYLQEYDETLNNDVDTWVTGARYRHTLNERTSVGVTGSWTRQRFARNVGDDALTDYYNLSGTLVHRFSRTLHTELSLGPTLIDSDSELQTFLPRYLVGRRLLTLPGGSVNLGGLQAIDATNCTGGTAKVRDYLNFNACLPAVPGPALSSDELASLDHGPQGQRLEFTKFTSLAERNGKGAIVSLDDSSYDDLELTYFARASVVKEWERWRAALSYQRSADESGSFGATSVTDQVELLLSWEPARHWTVDLTGGLQLWDQANEGVVPTEVVVANETVPGVGSVAAVQQVVVELEDDALSYDALYASLSVYRNLNERARAFATVYWLDQEQELEASTGSTGRTTTWNNLTFWVGVEWQFETFKF